ncbi:MAG: ferredoxin--NADP reductase [Gammaproteobacteria bacterium]
MPYFEQRVTSVRKWSDKTFSLTTTRPDDFEFENGEFVTIGLRPEGKLIARAYSIVSTNDVDYLEFLSIYAPEGPLTSRLVQVREGDKIWVNGKATGSLTLKYIRPGRNVYLMASGTGLAPFMCLIRDPAVYEAFERVILVHTVRTVAELAYRADIEALTLANDRLFYVPTVTREPFPTPQRGADLFRTGELFTHLGLPLADLEHDRVMICGNPDMNKEMSTYLEHHGWVPTTHRGVGNFTTEKAFVMRSE